LHPRLRAKTVLRRCSDTVKCFRGSQYAGRCNPPFEGPKWWPKQPNRVVQDPQNMTPPWRCCPVQATSISETLDHGHRNDDDPENVISPWQRHRMICICIDVYYLYWYVYIYTYVCIYIYIQSVYVCMLYKSFIDLL
jgi:hypothetical protein